MAYPKVKFKRFDIQENIDNLVFYAKPENSENSPLNFFDFTLRLFPELNGKLKYNMSDEEIHMVLDKEVRPILENIHITNSGELEEYQLIWDEINDNVMKDLEEKLNIKWNSKEITCFVGLLPVCPRDILSKTFVINYGSKKDKIIETGIHELCHMIYFEKWMEIYPDYSEEEFDFPHIAWYLSEAMIDPLINNETFKKYTDYDLSAHSVYYEKYIDGESVIDILRSYVKNYSIEEAIKKGYELFKNNKDIIIN